MRSLSQGDIIFIESHSRAGYVCSVIPLADRIVSSISEADISIVDISLTHDFTVSVQRDQSIGKSALGMLVPWSDDDSIGHSSHFALS
jgi:hypothetical protein